MTPPPPLDDEDGDGDEDGDDDLLIPSPPPQSPEQPAQSSPRRQCWTAERLRHASYKDLGSPAAVRARFTNYLLRHCRPALVALLRATSTTTKDYSLTVDAFDFLRAEPVLGHLVLRYPATLLPLMEAATVQAQRETLASLLEEEEEKGGENTTTSNSHHWSVKGETTTTITGGGKSGTTTTTTHFVTRVHARLVHLPPQNIGHNNSTTTTSSSAAASSSSLAHMLQASHVGRMVQVMGTVVRCSSVQMYESARTYACTQCDQQITVAADVEQRHNALRAPDQCRNPNGCRNNKFTIVEGGSIHTDYQEIKIQESHNSTSNATTGQIPRSLLVKVQHDLVDTCQPGDAVIVVGSLLAQWPATTAQQQQQTDAEPVVDMAMMAHSVRVVDEDHNNGSSTTNGTTNGTNDLDQQYQQEFQQYWKTVYEGTGRPIQARDFICRAVCPKLYGMAMIKLALLVTLIGGVSSDAYAQQQQDEKDNPDVHNIVATETPTDTTTRKRPRLSDENEDAPEPFMLPTPSKTGRSSNYHQVAWGTQGSQSPETPRQPHHLHHNKNKRVYTRRRDQSHLLLVGDPGVGKSQFLKFAAALAPRSVLTTGVGTTSAGLTCAAVRDGNSKEFSLEAGALVLADKGVCCIDEFGCIQDQDRTTIHEAMEQQTLSVAKAGIVCKLNCRATIIAVMNPRDCIYDNQASLSANTGLGTPLLSRFDLIFKLVDTADAERDNNVTMYLLNRAIQGAGLDVPVPDNSTSSKVNKQPWSMDKLRAYVTVVKDRFQPVMSDEAARLLEAHYEKCRSCQSHTIPVTVRFLESLIRLSQAHARLLFRNQVTVQDAVAVIQLMECSAFAYGGFDGSSLDPQYHSHQEVFYRDPMTVDFSEEADVDLACFEYRLLTRYDMLEYMPPDRQTMATQAMAYTGGASQGEYGWLDYENARERR